MSLNDFFPFYTSIFCHKLFLPTAGESTSSGYSCRVCSSEYEKGLPSVQSEAESRLTNI